MWAYLSAGLAIGVLGSFHCIGMCGPLALSLPINSNRLPVKFLGTGIYNAGRIFTYSMLGMLFGWFGHSIAFFGFQQWLSIGLGTIVLFYLFTRTLTDGRFPVPRWINRYYESIRKSLGKRYGQKGFLSLFLIGLLNGLLPCGLVYIAMAGALATGSILNSIVFMAGFGLGTLPVMWAIAFFGNFMAMSFRTKMRKAYPFVMGVMACLLIMRGLGLGIPYLSPKTGNNSGSAIECTQGN